MRSSKTTLSLTVSEDGADEARIEKLAVSLLRGLCELDPECIEFARPSISRNGTQGETAPAGVIVLSLGAVTMLRLLSLVQNWVGKRRNVVVVVETPDGAKVEFAPDKIPVF